MSTFELVLAEECPESATRGDPDGCAVEAITTWLEDPVSDAAFGTDGLVGASCAPGPLRIARTAIGAANRGWSATDWRRVLAVSRWTNAQIDTAEACMRHNGLWPWSPSVRDGPAVSGAVGSRAT